MNTKFRIIKNFICLLLSRIVLATFTFLLFVFVGRFLGNLELGRFAFAVYFSTAAITFIDLGLVLLVVREVANAKNKASEYVSNSLFIKIIATIVVLLIIIYLVNFVDAFYDKANLVYLAYFVFIFESFMSIFFAVFKAYEKMEYEAAILIIERICCGILCYLALKFGIEIKGILTINFISRFIGFILAVILVNYKIIKIKLKIDLQFCKKIFFASIPFALSNIFIIGFFRINTILLTLLCGDKSLGLYTAGYNIIEPLLFIPTSFALAIYPVLSQYFAIGKDLKNIFSQTLKFALSLGLPVSTFIFILSHRIIPLLYKKPEFYKESTLFFLKILGSISVLKITSWVFVIMCLNLIFGTVLFAVNKQKMVMITGIFAFLLHLVSGYILILKMNFIGASISMLFSQLVVTIINIKILNTIVKISYFKIFSPIFFASLITGNFVYLIRNTTLPILIPFLLFSFLLYLVFIVIFRGIRKEEINFLKGFIKV